VIEDKILERNSVRIEGIEMSSARRMVRLYKQAQRDLTIKLLMTPDNTYSKAKLEQALVEVDLMLRMLKERIRQEASASYDLVNEQAAEDAARELNALEKKFSGINNLVNVDAIIAAVEPESYLFNNYESSLDAYDAKMRSMFENALTQGLIQQKSWTQVVNDLESVTNQEEWTLARIVRTELHGLYGSSKLRGFQEIKTEYVPDLKKTLYHPMDARTGEDSLQLIKENLIVDLDQPFSYVFRGKKRVFMSPPERPNDRAILIPYRLSWK
jgi:hypothetical protein